VVSGYATSIGDWGGHKVFEDARHLGGFKRAALQHKCSKRYRCHRWAGTVLGNGRGTVSLRYEFHFEDSRSILDDVEVEDVIKKKLNTSFNLVFLLSYYNC
jgi:hypothetical protein